MTGPCMKFFTLPPVTTSITGTSNVHTTHQNASDKKELLHGPIETYGLDTTNFTDPFDKLEDIIDKFLFGNKSKEAYLDVASYGDADFMKISLTNDKEVSTKFFKIYNNGTRRNVIYINGTNIVDNPDTNATDLQNATHVKYKLKNRLYWKLEPKDDSKIYPIVKSVTQYPTGAILRTERFNNKKAVHMPNPEFMYRDRIRLKITEDVMQTAVNAFFIFIYGTMNDIYNLPSDYILKSTRTISMMRIPRDKLSATWQVIKGNKETHEITIETLEMYRPLFKYVFPQEMARLNLNNSQILSYIGTHAELDRHQVGIVASRYIQLNPNWKQAKYLNLMNNLLCGVPMPDMRMMQNSVYLQLNHQVFHHIHACEPIQRRLFFVKMLKSKALGNSYSWNANEVAKLGYLLTEVKGTYLLEINPESMAGLSARIIKEMQPENLRYITSLQKKFMNNKALNILARKLKHYNESKRNNFGSIVNKSNTLTISVGVFIVIIHEIKFL